MVNKHRHPLIKNKISGFAITTRVLLDQIVACFAGYDELADVFQCRLHTFSG